MKCDVCNDTGYYGDNGPGIIGNREYQPCDQCDFHPVAVEGSDHELDEEKAFREWAKKRRYGWNEHGRYLWIQGYLTAKQNAGAHDSSEAR